MAIILEGGLWTPKHYSQLPLHRNDGLELVLVERGSALWQVDGVDIAVEAGELFYTFPWQEHGSAVPIDYGIKAWWIVIPCGPLLSQDLSSGEFADSRMANLGLTTILDGQQPIQIQASDSASAIIMQLYRTFGQSPICR